MYSFVKQAKAFRFITFIGRVLSLLTSEQYEVNFLMDVAPGSFAFNLNLKA